MATATQTKTTNKVPSPTKLAHIVLQTPNLTPMVEFYKNLLGAHVTYENAFVAFLTYDDEHHRIALLSRPNTGPKEPQSAGLEHMAFAFSTLAEHLAAYKARKELHGIEPWWCVNHGPTLSMYYRDPDGNNVETQVDLFETPEEASRFMASSEFARNFLGADFDPEEMMRRFDAGEDERELLKRTDVGPRGLDSLPA